MRLNASLAGLLGAVAALPAFAEVPVSNDWQCQIAPYAWALSADGNVTVGPQRLAMMGMATGNAET
jgi:hypothetical protein